MLRRKLDDTFEYRHVEVALRTLRPFALTPDRKEMLRLRVMLRLGAQEALTVPAVSRDRWVTIPAGVGIAAAIFAGVQVVGRQSHSGGEPPIRAEAVGDVLVDGAPATTATAGQEIVARSYAWVGISDDVRVGVEAGAAIKFADSSDGVVISYQGGNATFVSGDRPVHVTGGGWTATIAAQGVLSVVVSGDTSILTVTDGHAQVSVNGRIYDLDATSGPLVIPPAVSPTAPAAPPISSEPASNALPSAPATGSVIEAPPAPAPVSAVSPVVAAPPEPGGDVNSPPIPVSAPAPAVAPSPGPAANPTLSAVPGGAAAGGKPSATPSPHGTPSGAHGANPNGTSGGTANPKDGHRGSAVENASNLPRDRRPRS